MCLDLKSREVNRSQGQNRAVQHLVPLLVITIQDQRHQILEPRRYPDPLAEVVLAAAALAVAVPVVVDPVVVALAEVALVVVVLAVAGPVELVPVVALLGAAVPEIAVLEAAGLEEES